MFRLVYALPFPFTLVLMKNKGEKKKSKRNRKPPRLTDTKGQLLVELGHDKLA